MADQDEVAALVHERAGYVHRGLKGRVAAVDEQLRLRGVSPDGKRKRTAAPTKPRATRSRNT